MAAISLKANNVIVKNFHITGWTTGIYGAYNNNTITANEFSYNNRAIALYATDYVISGNIIQRSSSGIYIKIDELNHTTNNLISCNQIVDNNYAFNIISDNGTTITKNNAVNNMMILSLNVRYDNVDDIYCPLIYLNNFVDNKQVLYVPPLSNGPFVSGLPTIFPAGNWDNGTTGNHWSDYTIKYPETSEIGNTGIGNTAYLIETDPIPWGPGINGEKGVAILGRALDHYPLVRIIDISTDTNPQPSNPNNLPISSPNGSNPLINIPNKYISITLLLLASLLTTIIVTIYKKHHKN